MAKTYFLYGTMSSGKSMELIKTAYSYASQNKKFLIGKSSLDDRDSTESVISRIGVEYKIDFKVSPTDDISNLVNNLLKEHKDLADYSVIMIDEAQFLTATQVDDLVQKVTEELNVPIMFFGLKVDFRTNLFEGSKRIIELAEELREIKTTCKYCNHKATLNVRLNSKGEPVYGGKTVEIGGNDRYQSVCRHHYFNFPTDRFNKE